MKTFEVKLDKPTTVVEYCEWDDAYVQKRKDTTTAIIVAFNEDRLKEKLTKLYPNEWVLSIKEIKE